MMIIEVVVVVVGVVPSSSLYSLFEFLNFNVSDAIHALVTGVIQEASQPGNDDINDNDDNDDGTDDNDDSTINLKPRDPLACSNSKRNASHNQSNH